MSSDVENQTCRVCRGEGTTSQPLYHPCKCRGSIKYIHQQCLMEWLKHSNKSTEKCEICNTNYRFKIIYDPQMPQYIPLNLIWVKFFKIILSTLLKTTSITLYFFCIIFQVPLFWKFIGRIYTWAIDGSLPLKNQASFINSILFGEFDIVEYISDHKNLSPMQLSLLKFNKFLGYTYFSGVRYLVVAVIVQIALFIEREWVVRDEAYLKALKRKIGKEPRTKLIDMLQQTVESIRNNNGEGHNEATTQRLENLTRAITNLQENEDGRNNEHNFEENLRRAIDRGDLFTERHYQEEVDNQQQEEAETDLPVDNDRPTLFVRQGQDQRQEIPNEDRNRNEAMQRLVQTFVDPPHSDESDEFDADIDDFNDVDDVEENLNQPDNFGHPENEEAANELNNNNGAVAEFLEVFGISLNLSTPLFLMLLCDLVIAAYLFFVYLIPHMIGNIFVNATGYFSQFVYNFGIKNIIAKASTNFMYPNLNFITKSELTDYTIFTINENIIHPTLNMIDKLFINNMSLHVHTLFERIIILSFGYAIICGAIYKLMTLLVSGNKPILGTPRRAYKVLFEITSTAKVFVIFAIEIFFFPVYCGWLLDFCAAPLFLTRFTQPSKSGVPVFTLFFTSSIDTLQEPYLRTSLYWGCGTLYMLIFAFYLGMIRNNILRPGVLFFLRTPDDPNTRLIHDALIKPFSLQIYRIWLIGVVYTAFILVGIGGVTWGVRYLVCTKDQNVFLPIQVPSYYTLCLLSYFALMLVDGRLLITKYVKLYWTRVFEISTHKLRLSHFILGKPISQERGYLVYRDWWQKVLGIAQPDYTTPVTYRQAVQIFNTDSKINACFVPDGNYVRAPDNDLVTSEKFVKSLFVPVTKDDKVLKDVRIEEQEASNKFNDHEDEQEIDEESDINSNNSYTIVYRPPNLKVRCIGLIVMAWIFAIILLISILVGAVLIGRPIVRINSLIFEKFLPKNYHNLEQIDWKLVDVLSIAIGLVIQLQILYQYDKSGNVGGQNEIQNEALENDNLQRLFNAGGIFNRLPRFIIVKFISVLLWIIWTISIHLLCVEDPYRFITDSKDLMDIKSLNLHFIASFYTVLPIIYYTLSFIRLNNDENMTGYDACWKFGVIPVLLNFMMVHVPSLTILFLTNREHNVHYVWPSAFMVFMVVKTAFWSKQLYFEINDQVKSEKYVKGRTIENVDLSEDEQ